VKSTSSTDGPLVLARRLGFAAPWLDIGMTWGFPHIVLMIAWLPV